MSKTRLIALLAMVATYCPADDLITTRESLFAPVSDLHQSQERCYADLDLNADGTNDLVLSESVSLGGTGGLIFNLYLGAGNDRYRHMDQFLAGVMAVETNGHRRLLWSYSHMSAGSGTLQYRSFDRKGRYEVSPAITIYPGDGGSDIANGVYNAIFGEKTRLIMTTIGTSNKGLLRTGAPQTVRKTAKP